MTELIQMPAWLFLVFLLSSLLCGGLIAYLAFRQVLASAQEERSISGDYSVGVLGPVEVHFTEKEQYQPFDPLGEIDS